MYSGLEVVRESGRCRLQGVGAGENKLIMTVNPSRWTSSTGYVETWLRISVQVSATSMWALPGHEVARTDICLLQSQATSAMPPLQKLEHTKVGSPDRILTISSPTNLLDFDKGLARIVHWSYKGQKVFRDSLGPVLTFWRGPTDNDKGGQLGEWKGHRVHEMTRQVRSVRHEISKETGALEITVESYEAPPVLAWGFETTTKYTVHGDGGLRIHVRACPKGPAPETLPRVGLEMVLPEDDLTRCQWFGLGPGQTYRDMKEAGQVAVWDRSLDEMIYMYAMPQENGNRTETRWTKIVNERGFGIKATLERTDSLPAQTDRENGQSRRGFDFSVSRFTAHALDEAKHPYELMGMGGLVFRIDDDHHGMGSAACGPDVMDQYKLKTRTFNFTVNLEPVSA